MDKQQISEILENIQVFLELKGENAFRARAYERAAKTLEGLEEDLGKVIEEGRLTDLPGIGKDLAQKIEALYNDKRLPFYEELKASVPAGFLELLQIPGLGPKKIKAVYDAFGIKSVAALEKACKEGKLEALVGFGKKTEENILRGIEHLAEYSKRHLWWEANAIAEGIVKGLRHIKGVTHAEVAGSIRRKRETIGDIDLIVAAKNGAHVMDWFTSMPEVEEVIGKGETKSTVRLKGGMQVDLRLVSEDQFYFALHHFTGSKEHNVLMRQRALGMGLSLSEWGLGPEKGRASHLADTIKVKSEEELFKVLGLKYIPVELREGIDELTVAEKGKFPKLIEEGDIRGVFHNHTTASDGKNTLEEMAKGADEMGWEYIGISDHSKSSFQAGGLNEEELRKELVKIQKHNEKKLSKSYVFAGVECDILKDGKLDLEDSLLKELDYVVISIHSVFNLDEKEMTKRMIKAIEHPSATIIGHVTGRLLLQREGYKIDVLKVIDAAIANEVMMEINANPRRLDMDWRYWKKAAEKGLMCVINPDAHNIKGLEYYKAGVNVARKGWLTKENVFNTRGLKEVKKYLSDLKKRKGG